MHSGVYWSAGKRAVNEDSVALEIVRTDKGTCALMVVCDGIGSLDHGEIAGGYVTECLVRWFYRNGMYMSGAGRRKLVKSISKCLYDCHMELRNKALEAGISWGSTVTAVLVWNRKYLCAHLGDSTAGVITKNGFKRITALHRNLRGELIKCVGSMRYFAPDISVGRLKKNDALLVASDGFLEKVSDEELGGMLLFHGDITDERIEKRLSKIGNRTEERGGTDNRSAVYAVLD